MRAFLTHHCTTCGEPKGAAGCERCSGSIARPELLGPNERGGFIDEYITGLRLAFRGIGMTLRSPKLLVHILFPALLNLLLFVGLAWFLIQRTNEWLPTFEDPFILGFDWMRGPLRTIVTGLSDVIAVVVALIVMLLTSTIVNAPFHEWISEAVESIALGNQDPRPLSMGRIYTVFLWPLFQAVVLAVIQGALAIGFLLISLSGVLAPLATVGTCWLLALSLADVVIARKGASIGDRFSVVSNSLGAFLGLVTPLFFVPFLIAFFVPGATLLFLRRLRTVRSGAT